MDFDAQSFGLRLREERERLQLSQIACAEGCGVRREMWGKYERGAAVPGVQVIARMGVELGADVLYLLLGRKEPVLSEGEGLVSPIELSALVAQVKRAFDRMTLNANSFGSEGTYWARIVALAAEIYNSVRKEGGGGGNADSKLLEQLALGAAVAEWTRFRERREKDFEPPK